MSEHSAPSPSPDTPSLRSPCGLDITRVGTPSYEDKLLFALLNLTHQLSNMSQQLSDLTQQHKGQPIRFIPQSKSVLNTSQSRNLRPNTPSTGQTFSFVWAIMSFPLSGEGFAYARRIQNFMEIEMNTEQSMRWSADLQTDWDRASIMVIFQ
jgi:hypothetical protein